MVTSGSALRFRRRDETESALAEHGYRVLDVRQAPDRPGREFAVIAERTTESAAEGAALTRSGPARLIPPTGARHVTAAPGAGFERLSADSAARLTLYRAAGSARWTGTEVLVRHGRAEAD